MTDQEPDPSAASEKSSSEKAPKPEGKKAGKDRGIKRKEREAEAEKALVAELDRLRSRVRQIATRYMELLESEIVQVREAVAASAGAGDRLPRLSAMLRALEGLDVKPKKGRRKDLKRIDGLVALLNRVAQKL
jgi:thioesterase domain-containing protein